MGRSHSKQNETMPTQSLNINNQMKRTSSIIEYSNKGTLNDPSLILEPFLFLGSAYGNRNTNLLDYLGITHVLNMAMELPMNPDLYNDRFKFIHILADDSYTYNIRKDFDLAFQFIDDARATGGKVLVHCKLIL